MKTSVTAPKEIVMFGVSPMVGPGPRKSVWFRETDPGYAIHETILRPYFG
jgi:hypothetical protein